MAESEYAEAALWLQTTSHTVCVVCFNFAAFTKILRFKPISLGFCALWGRGKYWEVSVYVFDFASDVFRNDLGYQHPSKWRDGVEDGDYRW